MRLRERLKLAFKSCAHYIYSISRFRQISSLANKILGVLLHTFYSFRVCYQSSRASSFFVQDAILWNSLISSVGREISVGRFEEDCLSSLRQFGSEGNVKQKIIISTAGSIILYLAKTENIKKLSKV
jgi:hypothetical protein